MMSISQTLQNHFPEVVRRHEGGYGEETVFVRKDQIHAVMEFLKGNTDTPFNLLLDLCGVDYLGTTPRFEVVYHLYSLPKKARLRVRVKLDEADLKIVSVTDVWEAADWFEREAFDMFGIFFEGHTNLKRLMMWEGFEGHPLRKDYPLNKRQAIPKPADIV
jgi:NADH-quinone oxidoreductase subunit C